MKRLILATTMCAAMALPAHADVTIKSAVNGKGMGMKGASTSVSYLKGMKMRLETGTGSDTQVMIFDVEGQKIFIFNTKKKEADVWDMAAFASQMGSAVKASDMAASVTANGQTKTVAGGKTATGYDMAITMPTTIGEEGKGGMKMTVNLTGPVWIVKGAPGTAEYAAFYKTAAEKGWIFGDPRAAKAAGGQSKAMTEMYRQMAATGGIPYEQETNIKLSGEGPMAGLMAKMGGMSTTSVVESVDTAALADDLFAVPAGYKLNAKK